jgi:hypothetical protein
VKDISPYLGCPDSGDLNSSVLSIDSLFSLFIAKQMADETENSRKRSRDSTDEISATKAPKVKRRNKKSKKNKGKSSKKGKGKGKQAPAPIQSINTERFMTEAREYLIAWSFMHLQSVESADQQSTSWKFNKRIQTWLIEHSCDSEALSSDIFKIFLDYARTIKGVAMSRLHEIAMKVEFEQQQPQPQLQPDPSNTIPDSSEVQVEENEMIPKKSETSIDEAKAKVLEKNAKRAKKILRVIANIVPSD